MARFKIGDKVRIAITIGSIYDKAGTITGYAQIKYSSYGQCYDTPDWKVRLNDGETISINERYLSRTKKEDDKHEFRRAYKGC